MIRNYKHGRYEIAVYRENHRQEIWNRSHNLRRDERKGSSGAEGRPEFEDFKFL